MQGFYFYRNGRLIDFPDEKNAQVEEHYACLRWEIEFLRLRITSSSWTIKRDRPARRFEDAVEQIHGREAAITATMRRNGHRKRARNRQSGKDTPPSQINNANRAEPILEQTSNHQNLLRKSYHPPHPVPGLKPHGL